MNRAILFLLVITLLGWADARAQAFLPSFTERPAEGWPAGTEVIYQPVVLDTTLLFPKPWLVWLCTCACPVEFEFYYEVDFRTVRTCWGRKEVFDREEVMGVYAFVQRGLGELYAMLEESGEGFVYKELSHEDSTATRTVQLQFDTAHVLRTDTAVVGQWGKDEYVTRITRYVELKPVR
ncbi:MAG: hypothetical protein JNJ91_09580 [Flavobacteriales bacterium]|nr:hypothetical protein [Flavobacteriales bacterium]